MARTTTPTCCLTLPLRLEKWQEDRLEKRFEIARQIYNAMLGAELKKFRQLQRTKRYREVQAKLSGMYDAKDTKSKAAKQAYRERDALLEKAGINKNTFTKDAKKFWVNHKSCGMKDF